MLMSIISLVSGFLLLIWSADAFTNNGAKIAKIFNISPLVIGLLIFGFGTSAPEMLVSGLAAYEGHPEMSIGNAFGSNIFNIALVLGITTIILPIKVKQNILKKEWGFLMISTLAAGWLLLDGYLSFMDGLILLVLLMLFLFYVFRESKKNYHHEFDEVQSKPSKQGKGKTWFLLFISLVVLLTSARLVVWGGTSLAIEFGVTDLIIGLTVVALGTSLPELAVSISSAIKKQHEMVVGNIIGSNLFNTLGVLAIPGLILPFEIPNEVMSRDYPFMLVLTVLLFITSYKFKKEGVISRFEGVIMIAALCLYLYLLFWN
jgi:cation:H+ antiporter